MVRQGLEPQEVLRMVAECQTQLHKTKVTKQVALAVSKRIKDDAAATEQVRAGET